jgi:hypothetical protein
VTQGIKNGLAQGQDIRHPPAQVLAPDFCHRRRWLWGAGGWAYQMGSVDRPPFWDSPALVLGQKSVLFPTLICGLSRGKGEAWLQKGFSMGNAFGN